MSDTIDGKEKSPAPYANVVKGSRGIRTANCPGGKCAGRLGKIRPAVEVESLQIVGGPIPRDYTHHGIGVPRTDGIGSGAKSLTATDEYLAGQAARENCREFLNATQPRHKAAHRVREAEALIEAAVKAASVLKRTATRLAFDLQTVGDATLLEPDVDEVAKALRDLGQFGFELLDLQARVLRVKAMEGVN